MGLCPKTGEAAQLIRATEAAIALLVFALLTLEVRSVFHHDAIAVPDAGFIERAFYVLVWGGFALAADPAGLALRPNR